MITQRLSRYFFIGVFAFAFSEHAKAEIITGVSVSDFSSEFPAFGRVADNLVNGSGLVGDLHRATQGSGMWHTEFGDFVPAENNFAHVTFDLGASYNIDEVKIWNYGEYNFNAVRPDRLTFRGVSELRISIATSDVSPTFSTIGDFSLSRASVVQNAGEFFFESESLSVAAQNVRLVRFDILDDHWINVTNDVVGLSEVAFSGSVTAVPEPTSFALLGIATTVGLVVRRRRKTTV